MSESAAERQGVIAVDEMMPEAITQPRGVVTLDECVTPRRICEVAVNPRS